MADENTTLREQKLQMWQEKLVKLEEELKDIVAQRADAATMGDLRENAAYQKLSEDMDTWRARIEEVKKIIAKLEVEGEKSA